MPRPQSFGQFLSSHLLVTAVRHNTQVGLVVLEAFIRAGRKQDQLAVFLITTEAAMIRFSNQSHVVSVHRCLLVVSTFYKHGLLQVF